MFRNINSNLVELKHLATSQIREASSLRADLSSLNDSVSNLSMCLQEHKQQTAAELAQLQTSLQSSLTTHTQQVNAKLNNHTHQLETIQNYVEQLPVHTCGGTGGWRRVVYLDMTDPSTTCPSGWNMTGYSKRTCGRASDGLRTCDSVTFPVSGGEYSRVCGRIKAYQWGSTDGFRNGQVTTIDGAYVDGISLTHSSPRQHIWTFVAGVSEGNPTWSQVCPCDSDHTIHITFVGNDYFCESGVNEPWGAWVGGSRHYTLHPSDPLWDGENCLSSSTCCSLHNLPYFVKQLPTPTTDNIEARICLDELLRNENIAVELVELYVQ